MKRIPLLGVGVDILTVDEVHSRVAQALADDGAGACLHVVTLNPEYVMWARADPSFLAAIVEADVITADGVGVWIAARLLGGRAAAGLARVTGVELCDVLAAQCAARSLPLFLLGGRDGVAEVAAQSMAGRWPGLPIAGTWEDGTPAREHDREAIDRIASSRVGVILVAYGAPGQVLWIARNQGELSRRGVRVAVGVGGSFDVLAGRVPRAHMLVRRAGLEWLYRLVRQPWRWRRQLALLRFAWLLVLELARRRLTPRGTTAL